MSEKPGHRAVVYGAVDCVLGLLAISIQAAVTYYCDNILPQYHYNFARPGEVLLNLGLASVGIWIGFTFLLTGTFGIVSGLRRRKPSFGTKPARDSYSHLIYGFFVLAILSAIFAIVLIAVSAALSAEWLLYLFDPPVSHPLLKETSTTISALGLVLVVVGLVAFPLNCIAGYSSWHTLKHSRTVGRVIFSTGPPLVFSGTKSNYTRTIEVVTRPASQVPIQLSPKSFPTPQLHEISRNPSFHSAVRNSSHDSTWSHDF